MKNDGKQVEEMVEKWFTRTVRYARAIKVMEELISRLRNTEIKLTEDVRKKNM